MAILLYQDPAFLAHDPGAGHVENAERLRAVYDSLAADPIANTRTAAPRRARSEEIARIHDEAHIDRIEKTADRPRVHLDADTATSPDSFDAALKAAGAVAEAVERVVDGDATGAFALVRPPGHHAEANQAKGFCLFNNVAIGAAHALDEGGLERVLVLDPDVHHGNGTQNAFWKRDDVLFVSTHRYPFYPGTGGVDETGGGPGRGYTVNLPLSPGAGDADLLYHYEHVAGPVVDAYEPELILVSAGFDTWHRDPLGGLAVTEAGFAALFALFRGWADRHCPGRIVCTLEGGYDPAGVVAGVRAAVGAMAAPGAPDEGATSVAGDACEHTRRIADLVTHQLAPTWPHLLPDWP